jgi:hypothetical protein
MALKSLVAGLAALAALADASIIANRFHHVPKLSSARERKLHQQFLDKNTRPSYNFSVPVDHFHNDSRYEPHSDDFYPLRYWIDDTYYKPGGPVIVVNSGELSSTFRIPYLETGIGKILSEAYGGLTVLLEHRYYGTSYPVPDLKPDNMRFLSTEQALADAAYFATHIEYPGLEHLNLTAPNVPYIMYGGSYAGAYVALARKIYPDVFWGAISGSGVPQVYLDYWEYLEAARHFVEPACVDISAKIVKIMDAVFLSGDRHLADTLKDFYSLRDLEDKDFVYLVHQGLLGLQSSHWDPDYDSMLFEAPNIHIYCSSVTDKVKRFPSTYTITPDVLKMTRLAGFSASEADDILPGFLNFIGESRIYVLQQARGECGDSGLLGTSCLSRKGSIDNVDIPQDMMRAWTYQTCTQWGYFVTGSGVPDDKDPLISRLVDFEYATALCQDGFGIDADPDMDSINKYGGLNFSHHRLAFVDGSDDPWRQAGVHRLGVNEDRPSTDSEPFILLKGGVHHWDEYGPGPNATSSWLPPKEVTDVQDEEVRFVGVWLKEWADEKGLSSDAAQDGPENQWDLEL